MNQPCALSSIQLVELFRSRGMTIDSKVSDKLEHINYYKLKEFAYPLASIQKVNGKEVIDYSGVLFEDVLRRYYQDKNLRIHIMHAIEKIEISVKTVLSRGLGERYGAFGYLKFDSWSNKDKYTRFQVEEKQHRIKKNILKSLSKATSRDYTNTNNLDSDGFPSIWLAIDVLTFGDIVNMLDLMNSDILHRIAAKYTTTTQEFLSWMKCIHFIRNICAHNSNLIDIKLKTKPKYRKDWQPFLYVINREQQTPTNKLAIVICIVLYMTLKINPRYKTKHIQQSIVALCHGTESHAKLLGFRNLDAAKQISTKIKEKV